MPTLWEAAEKLRSRRLSPVELTRECLERIERLNPILNAFITVTADMAMEQARAAEAEIAAGKYRGPLHGVPIALKDLFDTEGVRTTAASNQYRERVPAQDAEVVRRLKDAGAVLVGKTNMHEFAFGMSGVVSAFGPTRNPWNTERIAGGSSSGSAAAVAAGMCVAALGSDTSGSGRCPPALCGIVGMRPSAGVFSLEGVVPLCPSFDTVSPIVSSVLDILALAKISNIQEPDASDQLGLPLEQSLLAVSRDVSRMRVGVARSHFFDELHPDVARALEEALKTLGHLVGEVREIDVPRDAFRTIFDAEIYEFHEAMAGKTPDLYQPLTLFRVQKTAGISATDYIRECRRLEQFRADAEKVFEQVDVVITPTTPVPAPKLADLQALPIPDVRPFEMKYLLRNTAPFSSLFWPSVSVPCGFGSDGLPIGMQISARPQADSLALHLAYVYEEAAGWAKKQREAAISN
jgi:aspartyl-tRNA(Asn)/glutamyl-tRNA(Gln) amidotransferase subunit A